MTSPQAKQWRNNKKNLLFPLLPPTKLTTVSVLEARTGAVADSKG